MLNQFNVMSAIRFLLIWWVPLWLLLGVPCSTWAQSWVISDPFDGRLGFWEGQAEAGQQLAWGDGELEMGQQGSGVLLVLGEQYFSVREGFRIQARVSLSAGLGNGSFGLVWSAEEDKQQWYAFQVRADGYFRVVKHTLSEEVPLIDWTKHRKLKKITEDSHLLEVRKEKWTLYFLVDGKEIARHRFQPFLGKYRGMILEGTLQVSVDHFDMYHPPVRVPLARGAWPNVVSQVLDSTFNTPYTDELAPQYDLERDRFYFSRGTRGQGYDVWQAQLTDTGWTAPAMSPLSTDLPFEAVSFLHPKGKTLWLSQFAGQDQAPLVHTYRAQKGEWQEKGLARLPKLPPQRRPVSWYLSPNERILLFAAELPGGYGDQDIYVCFKDGKDWTEPKNLGPGINSYGRECCPYYDPSTQHIFFASNGFAGYGRGDLYQSRRQSNTWTAWEAARNLGPQINSPGWDAWFAPDPRFPRTFFYASQDTVGGDFDVYKIRVPRDLKAEPVVRISGGLFNQKTGEPLSGRAEAHLLGDLRLRPQDQSLKDTTHYTLILPYGELYRLQGLVTGYLPLPDTLDLRRTTKFRDIHRDLFLTPIEVGATIRLERIFFQRGTADLLPDSYPELNHLAVLMRSLPGLVIAIQGHTDNIGDPEVLLRLSEARAQKVRAYLIAQGIEPARMQAKGFGASQPIASNENLVTRPLNRRVEFVVISR